MKKLLLISLLQKTGTPMPTVLSNNKRMSHRKLDLTKHERKLILVIMNVVLTFIALSYVIRFAWRNIHLITSYSFSTLVLIFASMFLIDLLSALRIRKLFGKISLSKAFLLHLYGLILSDVTPGRVGYAIIIKELSKETNTTLGKGISNILLINATDTAVKIVVIGAVLLYLIFLGTVSITAKYVFGVIISGIIVLGAIVFAYYIISHDNKIKRVLIRKFGGYEFISAIIGNNTNDNNGNGVLISTIYSVLILLASMVSFYLYARPFGYSFLEAIVSYLFIALSAGIPAGIGGIGIQEGACIIAGSLLGKTLEASVLAVIYRVFSMIWHSFGLIYVFFYADE